MRLIPLALALTVLAPHLAWAEGGAARVADVDEAEDFYQRGRDQFSEGRSAAAAAHFRAAIIIDPGHTRARAYLVECLVLEGDVEAAKAVAAGGLPRSTEPSPTSPTKDGGVPPGTDDAVPTKEATGSGGPVLAPEASADTRPEAAENKTEAAPTIVQATGNESDERSREEGPQKEAAVGRSSRDLGAQKARRNPRAQHNGSVGLAVGGAAVTIGAFAELHPSWFGAFGVGVGGFLAPAEGRGVHGAVALSTEAHITPVPWRLTPLLGVGMVFFVGPGASSTEMTLWSLPHSRNTRAVPYVVLGARYDLRKRLWLSLSARIAPSPTSRLMPMPGLRVGLRF